MSLANTPTSNSQNSSGVNGLVAAAASTTISATNVERSSAPIAGNEVKTNCGQLWANVPSEDWLFATLCSWSTANPSGPFDNLDYTWEFKDPKNLPAVNVTTHDDGLTRRNPLMMAYEGMKGNGNSDANEAWWGGAFRNALLYSSSVIETKGKTSGHLLDLGRLRVMTVDMWLDKASDSPITVLSKSAPTNRLEDGDRYFLVTKFDRRSAT